MTDITGFGLMGHGREMAVGSGVTLEIEAAAVPQIRGALEAINIGAIPGGLNSNREFAECMVTDADGATIPDDVRKLIYDPQTSGGLLISVSPDDALRLLDELRAARLPASQIGRVVHSLREPGNPAIVLK